jgi:GGDEF domain-containing protein
MLKIKDSVDLKERGVEYTYHENIVVNFIDDIAKQKDNFIKEQIIDNIIHNGKQYNVVNIKKSKIKELLENGFKYEQLQSKKTETAEEVLELKKENEELKLDPLTKTHNRHYYNELQANSKEQDYYVSVVDLNGLKTINDTKGHLAGDNAIKELAEFLKGFGEVIRMGGDEFLVIAKKPHAELSGKFEKYCSATVYKAKGMDLESAYDSADKEMLRLKRSTKRVE